MASGAHPLDSPSHTYPISYSVSHCGISKFWQPSRSSGAPENGLDALLTQKRRKVHYVRDSRACDG